MAPVAVLGISCGYHDAAAALVRDGEIVAAAQEERFTRKRHDPRFPRHAINYCLEEAFIEPEALAAVVFHDDPLLAFDRSIKTFLTVAPRAQARWLRAGAAFLGSRMRIADEVRRLLRRDVPVRFTRHHLAHAASAFYPSPFDEAAILTLDGVGEWATTSIARGRHEAIEPLAEIHFPHSLGLLYSAFTAYCGFKVNSGEYKLMGLAPYGRPRYADAIREHLVHTRADGSFRLDMRFFGYLDGDVATNERFHGLFGGPPRVPESRISRRDVDLAASIQQVTEDIVLGLARHARERTGCRDLCLAGGVALNCVANGVLQRARVFDRLWVQPAAGDAGGALGAALIASHAEFGVPRSTPPRGDSQRSSLLGPAWSSAETRAFLERHDYPHDVVADPAERADRIAGLLADGQIVGLFTGRMEFGPRALGSRSILGDPRAVDTQTVMNLKIKYRESFRPFAPAVLRERTGDYFDLDVASPYMLLVAPVVEALRRDGGAPPDDGGPDIDLLEIVRRPRSDIPAVTHVDHSARVQTVDRDEHPELHALLAAFERRTGCAVLVNTSFNVRGEPIVCSPRDAYRCFMRTGIDVLVLGDCLLRKCDQPPVEHDADWRREHALD